jgi:prevent-host-death family protein
MAEVGIRALKQNASAVVARAAAGETLTVTDRGRPVAQLTPIPAATLDRLLESGQARRARHDLAALPLPEPVPPVIPQSDSSASAVPPTRPLTDEVHRVRADEQY